jgi:transposase
MLLVWDNLAGHKTAEMVVWLCRHGIMPLYTPLGGSWLNMAESIQRLLKRRALDGQHPRRLTSAEVVEIRGARRRAGVTAPSLAQARRRLAGEVVIGPLG